MKVVVFSILSLLCLNAFGQDKELIFVDPETPASFPGGYDSLKKFIAKNLKYPEGKLHEDGRVYISFTVNEDSTLTDIQVLRGLCEPCNKKAIELFSKMPKWIPGKMYNKPVKTRMVFPLRFTMGS